MIKNNLNYKSKEDLVKKMKDSNVRGWGSRNIKEKMNKFMQNYHIDKKYLYKNYDQDKPKLQINKEYSGLFYLLTRTYDKDPYKLNDSYNPNKDSLLDVLEYYNEVVKCVNEELDDEDRFDIINSYPYITMLQEKNAIIKITEKINELEVAMSKVPSKDRADFFKEIYLYIDEMILRLYEYTINRSKKEEKERQEYENNAKSDYKVIEILGNIKLSKYEYAKNEEIKYKNISQFLVGRFKEKISAYPYPDYIDMDPKSRQNKQKEKEELLKLITKLQELTYKSIYEVRKMTKEEVISNIKKSKEELIKEIDQYIENIENEFDDLDTIENQFKNILKKIDNNDIRYIQGEIIDKSYYEGYIKFIEDIRQNNNTPPKHTILKNLMFKKDKA